ncbi:DUF2867 domain-containing protein [Oceanospirillum sediminis]|uniref:DUF2867 domain-containing protein n=1 Tax=Oceanospirillum sediminis TaxID=2760088 RepID=A0A839IWU9_9GAMM|nr:DUF2867 domain-containing protein [Oceanospirillum sediminis]MBB1488929.1 DUF2867 domain-containing protein [Oceanospirillum sediminis]
MNTKDEAETPVYKVRVADLPLQSGLFERMAPADFVDCYCVQSELSPRQAANIITNFPWWARFLIRVRNFLTMPFGLSSDGPAAEDKVGFFPVESESSKELIAGFNDKHLNFRISVMSLQGQVFLATWVHINNVAGWLYFKTILPFHILIARNALVRVGMHTDFSDKR